MINNSKKDVLKLYTVYSPPNHPDGRIQKTKAESDAAEKGEEEAAKEAKESKAIKPAVKEKKSKPK